MNDLNKIFTKFMILSENALENILNPTHGPLPSLWTSWKFNYGKLLCQL